MEKFNDIIEKIEKMTVGELAELVKVLEEKFGVTASMPSTGGGVAAAEVVEKTQFNVVLKVAGDQKINVIIAIR